MYLSRSQLLDLLDVSGFRGRYDFVYLPIDFSTRASVGYAFINFSTVGSAELFVAQLQGFDDWPMPSEKVLEVDWSHGPQGYKSLIDRYRNSPVMHDSVLDELKPAVFANGRRAAFPQPTRNVKAPLPRKSGRPQ